MMKTDEEDIGRPVPTKPESEKTENTLQPLEIEETKAPARTNLRTAAILIALYVRYFLVPHNV